jgi:hypothetical protein
VPAVRRACLSLVILVASTCGRTELVRFEILPMPVDAGRDAGPDAGRDAGADAGHDAGFDAGVDAGFDAGTKPCIEGRFTLAPATPVVVLVLDKSGSMNESIPGALTKWDALRTSLRATLPAVDQSMELGLLLYPVSPEQACSAFVRPNPEPALGQVATILQTLDSTAPGGGTPTADALLAGFNSLQGRRTGSTARALVLATDGVPNCNFSLDPRACFCVTPPCTAAECVDDDRSVDRVRAGADAGIPTYVIGIEAPGAVFTQALDRLAVAGGRALPGTTKYYSATSAGELARAFSAIRDQVARCTFLTSSVPNAMGSIRVEVNGVVVPFDPTGQFGWNWTDRPNGELVFRGASCTQVMGQRLRLEALVGCGAP